MSKKPVTKLKPIKTAKSEKPVKPFAAAQDEVGRAAVAESARKPVRSGVLHRSSPTILSLLPEAERVQRVCGYLQEKHGEMVEMQREQTARGRVTFELWVGRTANSEPVRIEVRYTPEGFLYPGCKSERLARSAADKLSYFIAGR
jgi:hypothetical protein